MTLHHQRLVYFLELGSSPFPTITTHALFVADAASDAVDLSNWGFSEGVPARMSSTSLSIRLPRLQIGLASYVQGVCVKSLLASTVGVAWRRPLPWIPTTAVNSPKWMDGQQKGRLSTPQGTAFCNTCGQFLAWRALFGIAMGGLYGNAAAAALEDLPEETRELVSGIL